MAKQAKLAEEKKAQLKKQEQEAKASESCLCSTEFPF
jgi:hypothetical protein